MDTLLFLCTVSFDLTKSASRPTCPPTQRLESGVVSRGPHSGHSKWTGSSSSSAGQVTGEILHPDSEGAYGNYLPGSVMPRAPHVTSQSGSGSTLGQYIPTSGMFKGSDGRYNLQLPEVTEKQKLTRRYSTGSRYDGDNNQASSPVLSRTQYPQPLPQPSHVMPHVYAPLTHTQPASLPEYVELNQKAADKSVIHDLREHASIEKVQPSDCMEIIQHPQNCHVIVSHPLKLECAVCIRGSTEAPNYLWYKNGSALVGEVNKTYIVSTVTQADAGEYFCLVSDPFDRVRQQSNAAVVTVAGKCNCNCNCNCKLLSVLD